MCYIDIIWPNIKLPLVQTDEATENRACMDTHPHGQIVIGSRTDVPEEREREEMENLKEQEREKRKEKGTDWYSLFLCALTLTWAR